MHKFETFKYNIVNETPLNNEIILDSINKFWKENIISLDFNLNLTLIYRIIFYKNNQRITLLKRKNLTIEDKKLFQGLILNLFKYSDNTILKNSIIKNIVIKFKSSEDVKINSHKIAFTLNNYRITMTMDLKKWGEVLKFKTASIIRKKNTNTYFKVTPINNLENQIKLINLQDKILLTFKDIRNENDSLNTFVRMFNNKIFYIHNGKNYFKLNKRQSIKKL